jgi:hypothetical protein
MMNDIGIPTSTPSALGGYSQSNSIVSKFAFILVVLLVFIILLQAGMGVLSWLLGPNGSPKLLNGMVPGTELVVFDQDPNSGSPFTILRSDNQRGGIEFTWSIWMFVDNDRDHDKYRHVFSKGNPEQYAKKYTSFTDSPEKTGVMYPNNAPGLYLAPHKNSLLLIMNSFDTIDEEIEIDNIPLNKWLNVVIRVKNKSLDVFVNGIVTKSKQLATPPKQNYDKVFLHLNNGYSGYSSNLWYWNYAVGTNTVNNIVQAGPNTTLTGGATANKSTDYLSSKWYFAGQGDMFNPTGFSS